MPRARLFMGARTRQLPGRSQHARMAEQTQPTTQQRILVINDTQEILDLFRELLEEEGYEVVLFSYAPHEISEVEHVQPDLVIIDLIFGQEVLGWQLLEKLKMHRPTAHIPVVVCSAAQRKVREMEGYLTSMGVGVVLKPFDIDVFLDVIRTTLRDAPKSARAQQQPHEQGEGEHCEPPSPGTDDE